MVDTLDFYKTQLIQTVSMDVKTSVERNLLVQFVFFYREKSII